MGIPGEGVKIMMKDFNDFLATLTPEAWDDVIADCGKQLSTFSNDIFMRNGVTEVKAAFRSWPAVMSIELLRRYHKWLFSNSDNSPVD